MSIVHESKLPEIETGWDAMLLIEIEDDMPLEDGGTYVIINYYKWPSKSEVDACLQKARR